MKKVVAGGVGYAVAGPAGALVGVLVAGNRSDDGYDMSDIPIGVHVEAEHEDDAHGRLWKLNFLSALPPRSHARMQLLNDAGQRLSGHAPFADTDGHFVATAAIYQGRAALYVPFAAADYKSPKYLSLEVSVWTSEKGKPTAVGKGILDADMPAAQPWSLAEYLRPVVSLCAHVLAAAGRPSEPSLKRMLLALTHEFECATEGQRDGVMATLLGYAGKPLSLKDAAPMVRFRFPGVDEQGYAELLAAACFGPTESDGDGDDDGEDERPQGTPAQRAKLQQIAALLGSR